MKHRLIFTFDESSYLSLHKLKRQLCFSSVADVVKESLQLRQALQKNAKEGFTKVIIRNPDTGEERILLLPSLTKWSLNLKKEDVAIVILILDFYYTDLGMIYM